MKVIISHDVDHLSADEHRADLIIPKFLIRSNIEWAMGAIPLKELFERLRELTANKWQNLAELMAFDRENGVPSTFFLAVNQGKGLAYSAASAAPWIRRIAENGFDVGVHGIAFDDPAAMLREFEVFRQLSKISSFGLRMHYLRTNDMTLSRLDQTGYLFDSTIYATRNPYRVGRMWEFPLHMMDGFLVCDHGRWQRDGLAGIKERTRTRIAELQDQGIEYLTILFHDRYFSGSFAAWRDWYIWLIRHCQTSGLEFTDYRTAVARLDSCSPTPSVDGPRPS